MDHLTPNDLRVLIETEDEFDRKGQFVRIFPSPTSTKYLQFFDKPRYYNLLLEEWTGQYFHIRDTGKKIHFVTGFKKIKLRFCYISVAGIALLESYCKQRIHLQQYYDKS